jgi:hypothetical protein
MINLKTIILKRKFYVLSAVLAVAFIASNVGVYALVSHHNHHTVSLVAASSKSANPTKTADTAKSADNTASSPTVQQSAAASGSSAVATTGQTKNIPSPVVAVTPSPSPITPPAAGPTGPTGPPTTEPKNPTGSVTFSADGCYVTASGTPGLILSGDVHTSNKMKGGPMGDPDGIVIPASGSITEIIGDGSFDFYSYGVDAVLRTSTGATIASRSAVITAHKCM